MGFDQPNIEKGDWIKKRTEFYTLQGLENDVAYEKALEDVEKGGKKIGGMYQDPNTGEVITEETRKKIAKEMEEKGTEREQPSSLQ